MMISKTRVTLPSDAMRGVSHLPDVSNAKVVTDIAPYARLFLTGNIEISNKEELNAGGFEILSFESDTTSKALSSSSLPCAIVWSDPTDRLAVAIEEGTDLDAALKDWRNRITEVLTFFRKNRRAITLVEASILTAPDTDPAWEVLSSRLNAPKAAFLEFRRTEVSSSLSQMLAHLAIAQMDDLRDLLEELRASGVSPLRDEFSLSYLNPAACEYAQLKMRDEELALMRAQVELQVDETNRAAEERGLLRDQVRLLTQDVERLRASKAQMEARHLEALREKDQVLAQTMRDLEYGETVRNELTAQNSKLMRDVEDLTTRLAMVYESTSWRVTTPLRGVKGLLSKGNKASSV